MWFLEDLEDTPFLKVSTTKDLNIVLRYIFHNFGLVYACFCMPDSAVRFEELQEIHH